MAVNIRQLFPLQQAKVRRSQLPRYLRLDGGRYLIAAALILSLLSLISLGQTGRLAAQGYEIAQLQKDQVDLLRQRSALQLELSEAQSLAKIEQRARDLHMRPMTPDQARYITIGAPPEKPEQKAESQKPRTGEGVNG